MDNTQKIKDFSLYRYRGSIPEIIRYQVITKSWLFVLAWILRYLRGALLWTTTRSAVTSGDLGYWLRSLQGWLLILVGMLMLLLYLVFDVNAMIILSSKVLHQESIRVREILKEAFQSCLRFREPFGIRLILFLAFLVPMASVGLWLSLTGGLYIPDFITNAIRANRLYTIIYDLLLLAIFALTFYYIFTFHYIILGKRKASEAKRCAGRVMRENWKNFLGRYLSFLIKTVLIGFAILLGTLAILLWLSTILQMLKAVPFRIMISMMAYLLLGIATVYFWVFTPFQVIELTRIYETYTPEDEGEFVFPEKRRHIPMACIAIMAVTVLVSFSVWTGEQFDQNFPPVGDTKVIAHRGGGTLGNENTVYGLQLAAKAGADASEIDVQRTKDGAYIVNHDNTFLRLAGDPRKAQEMTLEEIQKLSVPDNYNLNGKNQSFATYEEMLEASRDTLTLYVEMKGKTADQEMAEDLYQIAKQKGMLEQVVFISLKYQLVRTLEENHPDARTGYLCYAAVGDVQYLDVDELILEEETATPANIEKIHEAGKKVIVWTINEPMGMLRFYSRKVDAIITDEVTSSIELRDLVNFQVEGEYAQEIEDLKRVILHAVFVWWF